MISSVKLGSLANAQHPSLAVAPPAPLVSCSVQWVSDAVRAMNGILSFDRCFCNGHRRSLSAPYLRSGPGAGKGVYRFPVGPRPWNGYGALSSTPEVMKADVTS